jgi:hypothetical protein
VWGPYTNSSFAPQTDLHEILIHHWTHGDTRNTMLKQTIQILITNQTEPANRIFSYASVILWSHNYLLQATNKPNSYAHQHSHNVAISKIRQFEPWPRMSYLHYSLYGFHKPSEKETNLSFTGNCRYMYLLPFHMPTCHFIRYSYIYSKPSLLWLWKKYNTQD